MVNRDGNGLSNLCGEIISSNRRTILYEQIIRCDLDSAKCSRSLG